MSTKIFVLGGVSYIGSVIVPKLHSLDQTAAEFTPQLDLTTNGALDES